MPQKLYLYHLFEKYVELSCPMTCEVVVLDHAYKLTIGNFVNALGDLAD